MRAVIVDDHPAVLEFLHDIIVDDVNFDVVGTAKTGLMALETILITKPDIVILDLYLPDMTGFKVAETVQQMGQPPHILAISGRCDDYTVLEVERSKVAGFLDKPMAMRSALKTAITIIANGGTYFSEAFIAHKKALRRNSLSIDKILTDREQAILASCGALLSDDEIGSRLNITLGTVEKHRLNILRKLGLRNRTELERFARNHGFINLSSA